MNKPAHSRHVLAALVVAVLVALAALAVTAEPTDAASSGLVGAIDNSSRASVSASYGAHVLDNLEVHHGWSGSTADCRAGSASDAFDVGTLETINWFRRMAGLSNVAEDVVASSAAQQAALMMDAAGALSHHPAPGWSCFTATGADAAGSSNLTLGIAGPRGVVGQIEDPGQGNEQLGHRRWLLFPRLAEVGIGNTARAGAVHVIGDFTGRSAETPWISWPPEGFVPDAMVFDRWSISFNGSTQADFSQARVSMTENGADVAVRLLSRQRGFGDNTLGWEPVGIVPTAAGDVRYRVTIDGVTIAGRSVSHQYTVVAFDPASPAPSAGPALVSPSQAPQYCRGRRATIVGTNGADTITGTNGPDVIVGLGGNDSIRGLGGNDVICAGGGHDVVNGGPGRDIILGGSGRDTLRGDGGRDTLVGQNGRDRLVGNQGNDTLSGGADADVLIGNTGRDSCWSSSASRSARGAGDEFRACERVG